MAALWLALAIDLCFGEPPARWHVVVWMGRYLAAAGRLVAPAADDASQRHGWHFAAGALAWCLGAAIVVMAAAVIATLAARLPAVAAALLTGLALKPLLSWRMLRDEVLAVESALGRSLDEGRAQLARLVSRDVASLDAAEVRESAIESLAENLSDSLVAPLFWFVLLGLPGAALYRFANTADAMWGYRGTREGRQWTWAGKWAARADDLLSWLPARLTACLLLAGAAGRSDHGHCGFVAIRREARRTPSPNSGWPMAAMALRLGVRLAKPGVYVLNAAGRVPQAADTLQAARRAGRAVLLAALAGTVVLGGRAAWMLARP
ncbi:adenosylcobinamide-phosphate synthase CbiB [Variovorax sp. J22P168]|uniref:adenosylcobinamide-phosphate synthase CbiB n=1 Tax=Variovorax jilinensis TaxID=3053513 RepID=UPI0025774617|nr:adenosylcobinamide-phosphate synthase CbiB [Variovorax sp. J22P168]MDM0013097.1 adenosylcobinamide-phosphate synthase CbiB [Variovorax sp. J22P168]